MGYERVDGDPDVDVLIGRMDATAGWAATAALRAWERERFGLRPGERLLDVGCGLGEAAIALSRDVAPAGEVVGVDRSVEMLRVATANAAGANAAVRFVVGDACELNQPDASFDAVRCERTLQWLTDPASAVREMVRVLRPSGRISLIDTDWSTLTLDVGDERITAMVHDALRVERRRASTIGRRLPDLARAAGCELVDHTSATHAWTSWDPDRSPAPDGCFSMEGLADDLLDAGRLDPDEQAWFVATVHDAARDGRFSMTLTMYAVTARRIVSEPSSA